MSVKQNIILLVFLLFCVGAIHSQDTHKEFRIDFRAGSAIIEPEFANNAHHFAEIKAFTELMSHAKTAEIVDVKFGGSTSLEGSEEFNDSLTLARRKAIEDYFSQHLNIPTKTIYYNDVYIDWNTLRKDIEQSDYTYKEEVLSIIDEEPMITKYYDELTIDYRILRLRKIHGGSVWKLISDKYFPHMRYAKAVFIVSGLPEENTSTEQEEEEYKPADTVDENTLATEETTESMTDDIIPQCKDQRLAVKTNFLYDAILLPSLELEYKINRHWSVSIEGDVAWWKNDAKHKYYQLALISPEVRYKLNGERPWRGSYIGLFGGYSWYDLENGGRGYKGEAEMIGLSYNYMWSIGKHLSLEAGIGAGVMFTQYEEYLPIDGHYVYQQTSRLFYAGPLKLKLALVWRLWNQNCK